MKRVLAVLLVLLAGCGRAQGVADTRQALERAGYRDVEVTLSTGGGIGVARVEAAAGTLGTGPAAEVLKLAASRLARRTDEMLDALRGAGALLHDEWTLAQLWSPAVSIGGGTDEVVKDVVAQRMLGLPRWGEG